MSSGTPTSSRSLVALTPETIRAYLLENPLFFEENADILEDLTPPAKRLGQGVQDFQKYMLSKLQDDYIALKSEHEDLIDLMQHNLQRQNRMGAAMLALMDAKTFEETLAIICHEFVTMLDHAAVGFFLEAGGWLDLGDYDGLRVVGPGIVSRWLNGQDLVMEEVRCGQKDLFGERYQYVRSQALVRVVLRPGLPHGLLALGHADPTYYATTIATEQVELLGGMIERCLGRWINPA
ncbi:MAG: DUF484 family protein [Alphaproteobacteria bacterium]|nr:DUF484 family protein [Alphaproteobacteria bacterium]